MGSSGDEFDLARLARRFAGGGGTSSGGVVTTSGLATTLGELGTRVGGEAEEAVDEWGLDLDFR